MGRRKWWNDTMKPMKIAKKNQVQALSAPECLWMQAGVVRSKRCQHAYRCHACRYDHAMRRAALRAEKSRKSGKPLAGRAAGIVFWKDRLKKRPVWQQPCIHHMKARIPFRACTHAYHCSDCEFDQYFQDQYTVHAVVRPVDVAEIQGFKIPQGVYLHRGHTWVKIEEKGEVRVGLDDFALRLMGPLDRVATPLLGQKIHQDRPAFFARRGPQQAAVLAPVSGVITAANADLSDRGRVANQAPYAQGWLVRVHAENLRQDLKNLMIGHQTTGFLHAEVRKLYRMIGETAGIQHADGGFLAEDIYGNLPSTDWKRLLRPFLRT